MKMLAPTVTSYPSPIHGQSIEVALNGQEQDGPTTVYSSVIDRFLRQGKC